MLVSLGGLGGDCFWSVHADIAEETRFIHDDPVFIAIEPDCFGVAADDAEPAAFVRICGAA